jgi:pimeloyl-ACP methyl ester carboxylesterase
MPSASASAWIINEIDRDHVNELFSWAFFGISMDTVKRNHEQLLELNLMHTVIRDHVGLEFRDASVVRAATLKTANDETDHNEYDQCRYRARQMTLEPVNVLHRPLLVYMVVALLRCFANTALSFLGFRRVTSTATGLAAWYRPSSSDSSLVYPQGCEPQQPHGQTTPAPLLFFHGIAPSGHIFYLPMILCGLAAGEKTQRRRAIYIFENPNISCVFRSLWYDETALDERQTVQGVQEILDKTLGTDNSSPIDLAGHSFGSVSLTWLLHSRVKSRIRSMLLIDPVTILLSEPDVMVNFLYSNSISKIRMLASSELGIQVYLRRHFAWYNAELWLQDVPPHVKVGVALSEHDEILNAPKVRAELQHHRVPHLYWKHVGHAHCVTAPSKWKQMRDMMAALIHTDTSPSISITPKKDR